jgi:hypothetical protein
LTAQYFQGNRNITRYEAAEMVAKAMAHMDKASVEQRALINKLADEYADELNNLGVRVSALENRVGNVKLTGDARIRYIHQSELQYDNGRFGIRTGYGKFKEGSGELFDFGNGKKKGLDMTGSKTGFVEIDGHFGNGSTVGVYYNNFTGKAPLATLDYNNSSYNFAPDDLWGAFASVNFGQKWNALVDYQRVGQSDNFKKGTKALGHEIGDADVWVAKLTYGKADFATPKSWNAWVEYINADAAALWGSTRQ